jgi:Rab GDP dissociation inhibitor
MSSGELTNILVSTNVTRYLEFKQVAGSFVQQGAENKATVAKVPSDAAEALRSPLMGLFEKRRMKSFIEWIGNFDINDPATHKGTSSSSSSSSSSRRMLRMPPLFVAQADLAPSQASTCRPAP